MKRTKMILSLILAAAIMSSVLSALSCNVFAYSSEGFNYVVNEYGSATITGSTIASGELNIPESIGGYDVEWIDDNAFYYTNRYSKVIIPSRVFYIGAKCFYGSTSITSVEFNSVVTTYIYEYAFSNIKNLKSVSFSGKGKYELSDFCFAYSPLGDEITLPKSILTIGSGCFKGCGLKRIIFENPKVGISTRYVNSQNYLIDELAFPKDVTIYADEVSRGHDYAINHGYNFVVYDSHNNNTTVANPKATAAQDGKAVTTCDYCKKVLSESIIYSIKSVNLSTTAYTYDGKEKKPSVKATDSKGKTISSDYYTVSYPSGRKKAGAYNVKITFKDLYSGTYTKTFKIKQKALKKADIHFSNVVYTGKATAPKITYKGTTLKKGTDYTVSKISKNKAIGTASVTVKFKGNYSGTVSASYKIVPDKVKGFAFKSRDTSSVTFKWKKVAGADGYKVYRYNHNNGKYEYYGTTKSTAMKITKSKTGKSKEYGYVIAKVRAYKKVGKTTYYGAYSAENSNCIKPTKPSYKVTCPTFGRMRVIFNSLEYKTTYVQIQICINKSFNSDEYYVINDYDTITKASDNHSVEYYGLVSNKYYYVRCRQYLYNKDMNPIYSAWGETKKIYIQ